MTREKFKRRIASLEEAAALANAPQTISIGPPNMAASRASLALNCFVRWFKLLHQNRWRRTLSTNSRAASVSRT
jgi:hypothetical protein